MQFRTKPSNPQELLIFSINLPNDKHLQTGLLILLVVAYLFLNLGIELDLKYVLEHPSVKTNHLIDTASKIRQFQTAQLAIFAATCGLCAYFLFNKK